MKGRQKPKPAYLASMTHEAWRNASLAERALHIAAHADAHPGEFDEFPKGSNWGPMVKVYLALAGILNPAPWCVAGLFWCLIEAGADKKKLPKFPASTYHWFMWALDDKRIFHYPRRGDIAIGNSGNGHGAFVTSVLPGSFKTIEGNSNASGSREGYEWVRRERGINSWRNAWKYSGFIRITDDLFEEGK